MQEKGIAKLKLAHHFQEYLLHFSTIVNASTTIIQLYKRRRFFSVFIQNFTNG